MENQELTHWGIKGMKWGRRRFQNKDGSLTPEGRKRYGEEEETPEAREARRQRTLKSTDASEIYKNRDLLSTSEIRERMDRINVEQNLGNLAANTKKRGSAFVDKAIAVGKKINEIYELTNTPAGKALKKQLGFDKEETKEQSLSDIYKNRNKMSTKALEDAKKRAEAIDKITGSLEKERQEKKRQDKIAADENEAKEAKKAQEKAEKEAKAAAKAEKKAAEEAAKAEKKAAEEAEKQAAKEKAAEQSWQDFVNENYSQYGESFVNTMTNRSRSKTIDVVVESPYPEEGRRHIAGLLEYKP